MKQVFTPAAPIWKAFTALAPASSIASSQETLTNTSFISGTFSYSPERKAANSSGSSTPAVSHRVMLVAPFAMAMRMASHRRSLSARVASWKLTSTSLHSAVQCFTCASMAASICGGFLRAMYSICTLEMGASITRRGRRAFSRAFQAASASSAVRPAGWASVVFRITLHSVLTKMLSALLPDSMGSSRALMFSRSSSLASSMRSLKPSSRLSAA